MGAQGAQPAGVLTGEVVPTGRKRGDLGEQVGTDAVELIGGEEVLDDHTAVAWMIDTTSHDWEVEGKVVKVLTFVSVR